MYTPCKLGSRLGVLGVGARLRPTWALELLGDPLGRYVLDDGSGHAELSAPAVGRGL